MAYLTLIFRKLKCEFSPYSPNLDSEIRAISSYTFKLFSLQNIAFLSVKKTPLEK